MEEAACAWQENPRIGNQSGAFPGLGPTSRNAPARVAASMLQLPKFAEGVRNDPGAFDFGCRPLAGPAAGGVEGYLRDPAHVDAGGGESAHGAGPAAQPLLAH